MSKRRQTRVIDVPRDRTRRVIEVDAPCDVFWRGAWHRGKVLQLLRKRVVVNVIPFSTTRTYRVMVHPSQLAMIGPTYEDVGKESAARAAARARGTRFLPAPDPDPDA